MLKVYNVQRESAKSLLAAFAAATAVSAAAPAAAAGHAIVAIDRDTIVYSARDATSQNTLTATVSGDRVRFYDPTVDGGIAPGPCEPGAVDASGFIIEVFCPRDAATRLRIDVADREDAVHVRESGAAAPVPSLVLGGPGSDRLTGGAAADVLDSGPGEDALDGGAGADELRARDGAADRVVCGEGADRAIVDDLDTVDATCETVDRAAAAPGTGPSPPPPDAGRDTTPPRVEAGALTLQRIGRSRRLRVLATASEAAELAAAAIVRVGGRRIAPRPARVGVNVAGGGAELSLRLSTRAWRTVRRALARGRRVRAVVTIVATDGAGNSSATRLPTIRLVR